MAKRRKRQQRCCKNELDSGRCGDLKRRTWTRHGLLQTNWDAVIYPRNRSEIK